MSHLNANTLYFRPRSNRDLTVLLFIVGDEKVGPKEAALIQKLMFESDKINVEWTAKKILLETKTIHQKLATIPDEHHFILVKYAACNFHLDLWGERKLNLFQLYFVS